MISCVIDAGNCCCALPGVLRVASKLTCSVCSNEQHCMFVTRLQPPTAQSGQPFAQWKEEHHPYNGTAHARAARDSCAVKKPSPHTTEEAPPLLKDLTKQPPTALLVIMPWTPHGEDDLAEIPAICGWLRRWHEMRVGCARAVYAGSREKTMEDNCGGGLPDSLCSEKLPPLRGRRKMGRGRGNSMFWDTGRNG